MKPYMHHYYREQPNGRTFKRKHIKLISDVNDLIITRYAELSNLSCQLWSAIEDIEVTRIWKSVLQEFLEKLSKVKERNLPFDPLEDKIKTLNLFLTVIATGEELRLRDRSSVTQETIDFYVNKFLWDPELNHLLRDRF